MEVGGGVEVGDDAKIVVFLSKHVSLLIGNLLLNLYLKIILLFITNKLSVESVSIIVIIFVVEFTTLMLRDISYLIFNCFSNIPLNVCLGVCQYAYLICILIYIMNFI